MIIWALAVSIMIFIFFCSSETADRSQRTSESFTEAVLSLFPSFKALPRAEKDGIIEGVRFIVRKLAHFSVYCGLGAMMYLSLVAARIKKLTPLWAFICSALYAVSDEIHQMFVAGRSGELRDVCIDSSGALLGIVIALLAVTVYRKRLLKKQKSV